MALKNSSEIKSLLEKKLGSLGYDFDLDAYSDILVKKIPSSEAFSGSTHQTHIAITGESKAMFPVLMNLYYYEMKETSLKSKDLPIIEVLLLKKNLQYLGINEFDSMGDVINTFTVSKISARDKGTQIELADMSVDGKEFLTFRKSFKEGDFLVVLKSNVNGKFLFICIRKKDSEDLISKEGFYQGEAGKILHRASFVKDNPTDVKKLEEGFEDYVKKNQIRFLTFHPAYSYQEFIEGITFDVSDDSGQKYCIRDGIFKEFCICAFYRALTICGLEKEEYDISNPKDYEKIKDIVLTSLDKGVEIDWDKVLMAPSGRFCLIIDEINRGDIAKIFGELITLLEKDKRIGGSYELKVTLPYSREIFGIPTNVFILGTMNTADRSIALIDIALRRRFGFIGVSPDFSDNSDLVNTLKNRGSYEVASKSIRAIKIINEKLKEYVEISKDKCIGHSFFFNIYNESDISNVWLHEIIPLLEEYCYSDKELLNNILFGENSNKTLDDFLTDKKMDVNLLIEEILSLNEKPKE